MPRSDFILVYFRSLHVDFRFDLGPDAGCVLTQGLTGLIARLLVANVQPESRFRVSTEKPSFQAPDFADDAARNETLFPLEACRQIDALALFY